MGVLYGPDGLVLQSEYIAQMGYWVETPGVFPRLLAQAGAGKTPGVLSLRGFVHQSLAHCVHSSLDAVL